MDFWVSILIGEKRTWDMMEGQETIIIIVMRAETHDQIKNE